MEITQILKSSNSQIPYFTMIRPTVARYRFGRDQSQLPGDRTAPRAGSVRRHSRHHRGCQSERVRPRRRSGRARAGGRRRRSVGVRRYRRGAALRAAGVKAQILIFGALSVSDLDGLFDCRLTPTISTPGAARRRSGRRPALSAAHSISPQDRYRDESIGFPARQPCPDAAGASGQRSSRSSKPFTRTLPQPTIPSRGSSTSSGCDSSGRSRRSTRWAAGHATAMAATARRFSGIHACGATASARVCCCAGSCHHRSQPRFHLRPR